MEDEEGYMQLERPSIPSYVRPLPVPEKPKERPPKYRKIIMGILLAASVALNVALIIYLIVSQVTDNHSSQTTSFSSCDWIPRNGTDSVRFDPLTAHPRIYVSKDERTASWGKSEQVLPESDKRFFPHTCVLGKEGFLSGRHCWVVEIQGNGEWSVGVARQSVKRKGEIKFSTTEGIWAIGEYWGLGNYVAFTAPETTKLNFAKKPREIRVFLDYSAGMVEFFNPETKTSVFTFSSAAFSGEKIYPWFRVWDGTDLVLHP